LKQELKRRLKYAILKYCWFLATFINGIYLSTRFPLISYEAISILFLGASAYILGSEILYQLKKGNIRL